MSAVRVVGVVLTCAALVAMAAAAWVVFGGPDATPSVARVVDVSPTAETPHITATVFFGAKSGHGLVASRVEVPLASAVGAQGENILRAALADPPAGALRVIPRGTRLRAFYIDGRGDAYVDLTSEVTRLHTGGSFAEALTVNALVGAVTANLSAVRRVRLLVDGHEAETLAGHLDIAGPLTQDLSLVVDKTH